LERSAANGNAHPRVSRRGAGRSRLSRLFGWDLGGVHAMHTRHGSRLELPAGDR